MKKILILLTALVVGFVISAGAQQRTTRVTGTIMDENGEVLPGAGVVIDGTTIGTNADVNGKWSLSVKQGDVLVFSFINYKEEKVTFNGKSKDLKVYLKPDLNVLDESVVIGYGTVRKRDLTGSVSSVSSGSIENFKTSTVVDAIGGQIAGVNVTSSDGTPGGGYDIKIRGVGSVNSSSAPLYIVDGFEVDNLDYLANNDIASIEVLKDASAAAIYGSRGANGVILVTTKSGREGRTEVTYNGSLSYRELSKHLDVLNPYEYVKYQVELNSVRYGESYFKQGNDEDGVPYRYQTLDDYLNVKGLDWQDLAFTPTWSQNHDVSVTGGDKRSTYTASFSHYDEDGIFANSGFNKNSARFKTYIKLNDRFGLNASVSYTGTKKTGVGTGGSTLSNIIGYRPTGGLYTSDYQLRYNSVDPILEQLGLVNTSYYNPILNAEKVDNTTRKEQWIGSASLNVDIAKGLTLRSSGTYNAQYIRWDAFYREGSSQADRSSGPYGSSMVTKSVRWTVNNVLTYEPKISKDHKVTLMLGQESNYNMSQYVKGEARDFPLDDLGVDNLGLGATPSEVSSNYTDRTRLSFFTRAMYNYKGRYMATATMRADASSVFPENHKWGYFPSFALAWNAAEEDWMDSLDWISNLKVRASWGIVGNDNISSYLSLDLYSNTKYGLGSKQVTVLYPSQLPNKDLKWEGAETINIGADIGLLDNRINITADAFIKDSKDLLLAQDLALNTGFQSQWQNIGKIRNKGVEITVNTINFNSRKFSWKTDFNISFVKNTLESLLNGTDYMLSRSGFNSGFAAYDYMAVVGKPLGNMYGYVFDGVYQVSDFNYAPDGSMTLKKGVTDISEHAGESIYPGYVKYKDIDGDGKITTEDRTIIGNGQPDYYGGLTNTFLLYGFDLSFMLQYCVGNDVYNAQRMWSTQSKLETTNVLGEVRDRWTSSNASNKVPSTKGYVSYDVYSRFIEDGSFLRLKNVTLGYTLPVSLVRKIHINKIRVYATAQNLFCLTKYSGYDPEVSMLSSNLMPSFDYGAYPRSQVYTFGLEVKF